MIESILREGKKTGFSAVEVFQEKVAKHEYENFVDYNASHSFESNKIVVRAFWEYGEPVVFCLSNPLLPTVKKAFNIIYSTNIPAKIKNYARSLPSGANKLQIDIFDKSISTIEEETFDDLVEKVTETMISFPGLKLHKIYFAKTLKKVYIANTNDLNVKYKKTGFNLKINFILKNNMIEINNNSIFFHQLDLLRMISRAYNLLNSLTDKGFSGKNMGYFIFSPEAATLILREFSDNLKLGSNGMDRKVVFSSPVNIVDNPVLNAQVGSVPFDDEGVQTGEKILINKGVLVKQVSDIKTAFANNKLSTGNGFRDNRRISPEIKFSNLYLKPSVLTLKRIMQDAGQGILVSLIKLKFKEKNNYVFSAYGYRFHNEEIREPLHFYITTSFSSYFLNILRVSKEIKFFYSQANFGSPYLLMETKQQSANHFKI